MEQMNIIPVNEFVWLGSYKQEYNTLKRKRFRIPMSTIDVDLNLIDLDTEEIRHSFDDLFNIKVNFDNSLYEMKEKEWHRLVGKNKFQSIDKELRDFLINAAGMFDLGFPIDIKKAYKYSIFNDES